MEISECDSEYVFSVDVLYGPTKVCGILKHRTGRIEHIKERLEKRKFAVHLKRFSDYGRIAFAFEGQVVSSCDARNLSFDGCSSNDPVTERIIQKLEDERDHAIALQLRAKTAVDDDDNDDDDEAVSETRQRSDETVASS